MEKISQEDILQELARIGFARVTDYLSVEGNTLDIRATRELSENQAAAVAAVERTSTGIRVKFYDKLKALELLGKQLGLFEGKTSQRGPDNHLLEAIVAATKEGMELSDLPELQQAAEDRNDLVESSGLLQ